MTANSIAVSLSEFSDWMSAIGYFEPSPTIAVATSGGSDSMALLLLAHDWAKARDGKVIALTVNHNLRPEAASEAAQVKLCCNKLGIEQYTLCWEYSSPIQTSIQAKAREARYRLMTNWCRKNNILHLFTAHHLDDQAETVFFRLARGSGLEGLSAMSAQTIISGVRLLRPFLQTAKSRLVATLQERNQQWMEDPSNQNSLYERVNIRSQLAELPQAEQTKLTASKITNKFAIFRNLLENKLASQMTKSIDIYPQGYASINISEFCKQDREIAIKSLAALIQTLGGSHHPPRGEKLNSLFNTICTSKRSLGGLLFEPVGKQEILVYREAKSLEKPCLIPANTPILWDNRFLVEWQNNSDTSLKIELRALGSDGLAQIKKLSPPLLRNAPPARILRTLPSLWLLDELINVPHIGYMTKNQAIPLFTAKVKFYPAKPLAGSSFFVMNNRI